MKLLVIVLFASIQTTLQAHLNRRWNEDNLYYNNINELRDHSDHIESFPDAIKNEIFDHPPKFKPSIDRRHYKPIMVLTLTADDNIKNIINDMKRDQLLTKLTKKVKDSKKSGNDRDWFNALLSAAKDFVDLIDKKIYEKPKYPN